VHFEVSAADGESMLRWGLWLADPAPDGELVRHFRRRINELINAGLRFTYGQ
jgi:hypothetical protein